jgi:hypothetical protein
MSDVQLAALADDGPTGRELAALADEANRLADDNARRFAEWADDEP